MRYFRYLRPCLFSLGITGLLLACSSTPTHNPTVFPFEIDEAAIARDNIKTVVIAHVNLGPPSRNYLEKEAPRIDAMVSAYLKENGFTVLPQREFEQRWNTAVRAFGNPVDPTTGRINPNAFSRIMNTIRDEMRSSGLDAFIFTDLIELETSFSGGLQHIARWDGVTRKPSMQGPGDGVSVDFDWNTLVDVASLQVSIFDMDLKRVFVSRGGLDATQAIDSRSSSGRYVRRREILESERNVREGIELAFYPFIQTENWPGNE
ncbi:MAG: hypothetical protein AAF699_09130 [Pseudomonadota bacterium]